MTNTRKKNRAPPTKADLSVVPRRENLPNNPVPAPALELPQCWQNRPVDGLISWQLAHFIGFVNTGTTETIICSQESER